MAVMCLLQLGLVGVGAVVAIRKYKSASVPWYISVLTWLSCMVSIGIMLILPYDIYSSSQRDSLQV